jgi:hypothetical protein
MRVATQTYVAAAVWAIMLGAAIFLQRQVKDATGVDMAINVVSLLISALVSLYAINCMVVGNCNLFAWFYVLMMALSVSAMVVSLIVKRS